MRCPEDDLRRLAGLVRFEPARGAEAPAVAGLQALEAPLRPRCRKIVSAVG